MRIVWRCLLALVVIWSLAVGAIFAVQWSRPTPQKFTTYVTNHPLEGLNVSRRARIVNRAARMLNGLNLEQREELKNSGILRTFLTQMTSEERRRFLAATVPEGFRQIIAALNKMEPAQRKKVVQQTLRDLRSTEVTTLSGENDLRKMISEGFSIFNEQANPQVKLDFAPVLEEIQRKQEKLATGAVQPKL